MADRVLVIIIPPGGEPPLSCVPKDAANLVCHEDQLRVWAGEITGSLSMGQYFADGLTYDDGLDIERIVMSEIKDIVHSAFRHPELPAPYAASRAGEVTEEMVVAAHDAWIRHPSVTDSTKLEQNRFDAMRSAITAALDRAKPSDMGAGEAMREAAAKVCDSRESHCSDRIGRTLSDNIQRDFSLRALEAACCATAIRALPLAAVPAEQPA